MANEKRLIDANVLMDSFCQACSTNKRYHRTDAECRSKRDSYGNGCFKMRLIENAPTVDAVEVVHGRWETANDGTHFCPHCGCDAPYTWDEIDRNFINSADDVPDRPSNYCPNCGARMMGGGNEDGT